MLVQTSVEEVFAVVARQQHTWSTHEELWSSFIGLRTYFPNTGLKNKHKEQRREKQSIEKKKKIL